MYTIIGTSNNVWRKEHHQTVLQTLMNLLVLMQNCYMECSPYYVYSMNASQYRAGGAQKGHFLRKDDSCYRTLVIYI